VILSPPAARDNPEFLARVRASRRLHRPWIYAPATPERFAALMARSRTPGRRSWLVRRRADGALVGVVNVSEIVRGALQSAYLGYYAFAPHAGQGYMREALAAVLRHAFGPLRLHRLEANIQPANRRSIALVRGLGFRREGFSPRYLKVGGRWRDHERWAIVRDAWLAARRSTAPAGGGAAPASRRSARGGAGGRPARPGPRAPAGA
jgi:ribosomal-protein-alanine N-acetyltransferase